MANPSKIGVAWHTDDTDGTDFYSCLSRKQGFLFLGELIIGCNVNTFG